MDNRLCGFFGFVGFQTFLATASLIRALYQNEAEITQKPTEAKKEPDNGGRPADCPARVPSGQNISDRRRRRLGSNEHNNRNARCDNANNSTVSGSSARSAQCQSSNCCCRYRRQSARSRAEGNCPREDWHPQPQASSTPIPSRQVSRNSRSRAPEGDARSVLCCSGCLWTERQRNARTERNSAGQEDGCEDTQYERTRDVEMRINVTGDLASDNSNIAQQCCPAPSQNCQQNLSRRQERSYAGAERSSRCDEEPYRQQQQRAQNSECGRPYRRASSNRDECRPCQNICDEEEEEEEADYCRERASGRLNRDRAISNGGANSSQGGQFRSQKIPARNQALDAPNELVAPENGAENDNTSVKVVAGKRPVEGSSNAGSVLKIDSSTNTPIEAGDHQTVLGMSVRRISWNSLLLAISLLIILFMLLYIFFFKKNDDDPPC